MKTTIDIPDEVLEDVLKFTGAKTKRDAVVTAVADYNRRQRMAALTKHIGTCKNLMSLDDLKKLRQGA